MGLVADGGPTPTHHLHRLEPQGHRLAATRRTSSPASPGNIGNVPDRAELPLAEADRRTDAARTSPRAGPARATCSTTRSPCAANRETVGGELLVTYDPTPATWHVDAWDNDVREDARSPPAWASSCRHLPTTQDASIGIAEDGVTTYAFPLPAARTPARDLWEVHGRVVSRLGADLRMVGARSTGAPASRTADDLRARRAARAPLRRRRARGLGRRWRSTASRQGQRLGPVRLPPRLQPDLPAAADGRPVVHARLAELVGLPATQTRLGLRGTWRSLDRNSPRYLADPGDDAADPTNGSEWEIRTYLIVSL